MWKNLREGVIHHFRLLDVTEDTEDAGRQLMLDAHNKLRRYSELAERHIGPSICTYNLHMANCRLLRQQASRGHTVYYGEWWMEQLVQSMKSTVKYRTSKNPEPVIVNAVLLLKAMAIAQTRYNLKTLEDHIPDSQEMKGFNLDQNHEKLLLLGNGRRVRSEEKHAVVRAVRDHLAISLRRALGPLTW